MQSFPIYEPRRKLSVVVIGAGAAGLLLAYKLRRHFGDLEIHVLEKNADISGTWFENTYPGCACDVPSHCYTWSFAPKTDWSGTYASSSEIHKYFTDFASQHRLHEVIHLSHKVTSADWHEESGRWEVIADDLCTRVTNTFTANIVINATGILNSWKWPDIKGLHSFEGDLLHSAAWDSTVDLSGKRVGLIGNGSTGIQILPAIQPHVKHLHHFIRQPTWVAPIVHAEPHKFTAHELEQFATDKNYHLDYRRKIEKSMNGTFSTFHAASPMQRAAVERISASMRSRLAEQDYLAGSLIPSFAFGCRRPTPGVDYLEKLLSPNVSTHKGAIAEVTKSGIVFNHDSVESGTEIPLDTIICATGFDTSFRPRISIRGRSGVSLSDAWADEVKAYLGIAVPGYPNFFTVLGPNCPVGNGPVLPSIEVQVSYIVQMLSKFQKENIQDFEVNEDATDSFNDWKDEYMKHTVWNENCRSWYKAGSKSGKIVALWPGSTLHFLETMKTPRYEDWTWRFPKGVNRWQFLGNGHSSAEKRLGGDLSWYIQAEDTSPVDPCLKQ